MNSSTLPHGVVGNGRVIALVGADTSVDWLCLPRFDSPSVFGRLLDEGKGGSFAFTHQERAVTASTTYLPNTNVLRHEITVPGGTLELLDFCPRIPRGLDVEAPLEVVRLLRPLTGQPRVGVRFDPRPDYARMTPTLRPVGDGVEVDGSHVRLVLHTSWPVPSLNGPDLLVEKPMFFVLRVGPRDVAPDAAQVAHELELTTEGWRRWAKTCAIPSFAPEHVLRSALCLKLHASLDTGAIMAAPTTSIPEALGTPRTWDYRYCWLRDAAFVVGALRRLSHLQEGEAFIQFLRNVAESGPLQPVYGMGGERHLPEVFLPHLAGFMGNGHVRVGNQASTQRQNDLMGELVLCLKTLILDPRLHMDQPHTLFPLLNMLVEHALAVADDPDTGIWEFRSLLRPYTFSRAMCWAAAHHGAQLAAHLGEKDAAQRWSTAAQHHRHVVLERGFNAQLGFFTQALDGMHPDASNLLLPMVGLLDARDPRFVSTVDAYEKRLVEGGFMLRYRNPDDFGDTSSAFTLCSFWWVEALALMGRADEAVKVFERVCSHANALGLFSEDIEPGTGRLLGNFPQAYTHVGLINAASTLGAVLDARGGALGPWQ